MKINVLTSGRFHIFYLARELNNLGYDVKLYSFIPSKRAEKFGLPSKCSKSLVGILLPFLFLEKKLFKRCDWARRLRTRVQDFITAHYMRRCDVVLSISGSFLYSVRKAKDRGCLVILHRGSKHILEQKRILEAIPGWGKFNEWNVKRELATYEIADYVALLTQHCYESFLKHNYPAQKLFVCNSGVDLSMFSPIYGVEKSYDVIMVGGWSLRKGCDLIVHAVRKMGLKMLHVGGIVDYEFPNDVFFTHVNSVDQSKLREYYNQAKVFVLPSREEGLAMVQAQSIACNLPIVGSPDSGAEDLKRIVDNPDCVVIIKEYTVDAVCDAITEALAQYDKLNGRQYAGMAIENLTWESYGKRYAEWLKSVMK